MKLVKVNVRRSFAHSEDGLTGRLMQPGTVDFVREDLLSGLLAEGYVSKWWPEEDEAKALPGAPENRAIMAAPQNKRGRPRKNP